MKYVLLLGLFLGTYILYSQESMNAYKYIIVPKKFDGFKKDNQYQTSTLVKYLLTEHGFNVVYEDALPEELNRDRCLGLLAELVDNSSMFSTKAALVFKDCESGEVFKTPEGISKIKDFQEAYQEVLRDAFTVFRGHRYAYQPEAGKNRDITINFDNDVREVDALPGAVTSVSDTSTVVSVATPHDQRYENRKPAPSAIKKAPDTPAVRSEPGDEAGEVWYAQAIPNGYQLVDNTPKVRLKIYTSSLRDVFIATGDAASGLVYKKDNMWIYEYLEEGRLQTKFLTLKF